MKRKAAFILFVALAFEANAANSFSGQWFWCAGTSGESESMTVKRVGEKYFGLLESSRAGGSYSAKLKGSPRKGVLKLLGCKAYREQSSSSCETLMVTLGAHDSLFRRISPRNFEHNIAECRANHKRIQSLASG